MLPQRSDDEHYEDPRHGKADVNAAHQDRVSGAAEISGDCSDHAAHRHGDEHRERPHTKRDSRAVQQATPDIRAEQIGTERMLPRWRLVEQAGDVDLEGRPVWCKNRREERQQHEEDQPADRDQVCRTLNQATSDAPRMSAQQDECHERCAKGQREFNPVRRLQAPTLIRVRGSMAAYVTSASKLPMTTSALARRVVAATTG